MAKLNYHVAFVGICDENRGTRTRGVHESPQELREFLASDMTDGSGRKVNECYSVLYEGYDEKQARETIGDFTLPMSFRSRYHNVHS